LREPPRKRKVQQNKLAFMRQSRRSLTAFLASGHTKEELNRRLSTVQTLSDYEEDLLKTAMVEIEKNRRFFELAKALLGTTRFITLVSEAKG